MSAVDERLRSLAAEEHSLRGRALGLRLSTREAFNAMTASVPPKGEFGEILSSYAAVHAEYVRLAAMGSEEALKRALFIQWYPALEPANLSGIARVEAACETAVFEMLEALAERRHFSAELQWMVALYGQVGDFYFDHHHVAERYPCLGRALVAIEDPLSAACSDAPLLQGRGQMGDYWASMIAADSKPRP